MRWNLSDTEKPALVAARMLAGILVISAIAKLVAPSQILNTFDLLSDALGIRLPFFTLSILAFLLIGWEILIGTLFILDAARRVTLLALLGTVVSFIFVSLYLNRIEKLDSCGCMGSASHMFLGFHFPYLYLFCAVIIILLSLEALKKESALKSGKEASDKSNFGRTV